MDWILGPVASKADANPRDASCPDLPANQNTASITYRLAANNRAFFAQSSHWPGFSCATMMLFAMRAARPSIS